jgi:hypothetical protein
VTRNDEPDISLAKKKKPPIYDEESIHHTTIIYVDNTAGKHLSNKSGNTGNLESMPSFMTRRR